MSATDGDLIDRMAKKHSVSPAAVGVVLKALRSGGGRMAQFSHADFGEMSQWSPGMSMVGDMFNKPLNAKLDALCSDIAAHLERPNRVPGHHLGRAAPAKFVQRLEAKLMAANLPIHAARSKVLGDPVIFGADLFLAI
jgi:hypothetical protein